MAKIASNLDRLSVNDKIPKGRTALTAAGSANGVLVLGTPAPTEVADLLTATDALETARNNKQTADNASKTATTLQQVAEDAFDNAYGAYGRVGQNKSGGDATKIGHIGMDIAGAASPIGELPAPSNVVATMGDMPGEMDVASDGMRGASSFIFQFTTTPNNAASYQQAGVKPRSSMTIPGLISGTTYWFRMAAVGTAGQSPWSDPAEKMAP